MQNPAISQGESNDSSQAADPVQPWEHIHLTHLQNPPGSGTCHFFGDHTLFISLSSKPVPYVQSQDGKTFRGLCRSGDMLITPANTPLTVSWDGYEDCLMIQLSDSFLRKIAQETLPQDCDTLQLIPEFQVRNDQLESVGRMLLMEVQQDAVGRQLYVDALANALTVNLLRHHLTTKPQVPVYDGGLPPRQLRHILDFIEANLDQNLKLENLAELLDMSQFHFSRLFKQSLGSSPYQYLIQQRIERAKQRLKKTDQSIVEIALDCGFSSHSHLSKQFRQVTGMTPKAYRIN